MQEYTIREMAPGVRCRWVYDEDYETRGSYAYDSEAEDKEAEEWELARLNDGRLVALGCIVERFAKVETTTTFHDGRIEQDEQRCWVETDSLWGIVIEPDNEKLDEFARDSMDIGIAQP